MLPDFLSSSYTQYKDDTSAFTTWLGRAAEACGYKPKAKAKKVSEPAPSDSIPETPESSEPPKGPRLKGKARKAAQQAAAAVAELSPRQNGRSEGSVKYVISTRELVAQIQTVASSKTKISMPFTIQRLLERAIKARRRCSDWYETAKQDSVLFDQGGHRHFIHVLQDAFSKLGKAESDANTATRKLAVKNKDVIELENSFSALEVEDVDDSFLVPNTNTTRKVKPTDSKQKMDVFEPEQPCDEAFRIFCFFEDLHRIQAEIQQCWKDCNAGTISLAMATIITETAVRWIQQAERDICSSDDSYQTLAGAMIAAELLKQAVGAVTLGKDPEVEVTDFDDIIYLPVARILSKFIMIEEMKVQWPAPIPPFRFLHSAHKLDLPEHQKLEHDDVILSQLLLELQLPDKGRRYTQSEDRCFMTAHDDIFVRMLRPVWVHGKLTVTTVVTAQMLLDIIEACGTGTQNFYKHLSYAHHHASQAFEFEVVPPGRSLRACGGVNWPRHGIQTMLDAHDTMERIRLPVFPELKSVGLQFIPTPKVYSLRDVPRELLEGTSVQSLRDRLDKRERPPPAMEPLDLIQPAKDDNFVLKNHALYSGSALLKLLSQYHAAGISLANHHLSIFAVAHLYNALRKLHLLDHPWPVMDRIIQIHAREIFADAVPYKTKDIVHRLEYRLNVRENQKKFLGDKKFKLRQAPVAEIVACMLDTESRQDKLFLTLEKYAEKTEPTTARQLVPKKMYSTPNSFIASMDSSLSQSLDDMAIDYIMLTKRCINLLNDFRKMWNVELQAQGVGGDEVHKPLKSGNDSNDRGHLQLVNAAFLEAEKCREWGYTYRAGDGDDKALKGRLHQDPDDLCRHGRGLCTAAKVFKHFLAKEKSDFKLPLTLQQDKLEKTKMIETQRDKFVQVPRLANLIELRAFLSSNTYFVCDFYTDYDKTHVGTAALFNDLAQDHAIPGILGFARANKDDIPEVIDRYCQGAKGYKQTFVFFKEGKQVAVNGNQVVAGSDKKALKAAGAKLGNLAKKRQAQAQAQPL